MGKTEKKSKTLELIGKLQKNYRKTITCRRRCNTKDECDPVKLCIALGRRSTRSFSVLFQTNEDMSTKQDNNEKEKRRKRG